MHTDRVAEDVLVVLAHQDDEVGLYSRIVHEHASGNRIWCAYLTDGAANAAASKRDRESLAVLARAGVPADRVAFLRDDAGRIADGMLMHALQRARTMLRAWASTVVARFTRLYTLDWEGGHHDHDAAHLVALAAARDLDIPDVWTFALYNAYRRPRRFYRVGAFIPAAGETQRRSLRFSEALAAARTVLAYPSQRRTWFGLGPGFVVRTLARREERVRRADARRLRMRPHAGPLLYETMFGIDADEMLALSSALRHELCAGGTYT